MSNENRKKSTDEFSVTENFEKKHLKPLWEQTFPVIGQGTFIFNLQSNEDDSLWISVEDKDNQNSLVLLIDTIQARFLKPSDKKDEYKELTHCADGLKPGKKISYWYSYDRNNLVLKYGTGYRMEETTLMKYNFLEAAENEETIKDMREKMKPFFNAMKRKFVRQYTFNTSSEGIGSGLQVTENNVEFEQHPFICNIPPLVLDSSRINLLHLAEGEFVFSASLPPACNELYQNIKNCTLRDPDGMLPDAIRYSLNQESLTLYKKIAKKMEKSGTHSYLRVTFGHSLGKSPGIPYVLEIWPKKHSSRIHNHGNANAVIKVLFGKVHVNIYNKDTMSEDAKPIKEFDVSAGDVTWINRNWYQTHMLHNESDDYCATLQCYSYDPGDTTHWPYFDFRNENKVIEEFLPNSDFTFQEMREAVLKEYKEFLSSNVRK